MYFNVCLAVGSAKASAFFCFLDDIELAFPSATCFFPCVALACSICRFSKGSSLVGHWVFWLVQAGLVPLDTWALEFSGSGG
jgi:hypothetical protein